MRLSEQNVTKTQLAILTQLTNQKYLPILKSLQGETGILPQNLIRDPAFVKMMSNIFYLGRSSNGERGLTISGSVNDIKRDLKKIISATNMQELNNAISSSGYGDPAFGINDASSDQDMQKIQAFAKTFTAILNRDQTTFSKFVKTNKTVQKAKDYVRNPAKAFSDFSGAVSNPGNTADILAQPFKRS